MLALAPDGAEAVGIHLEMRPRVEQLKQVHCHYFNAPLIKDLSTNRIRRDLIPSIESDLRQRLIP